MDKNKVAKLERELDFEPPKFTFCLVRVGREGRATLFETNHRPLALYWHCILLKKSDFPNVRGVLAQTSERQPFQSE